jgi:hypothetical protein
LRARNCNHRTRVLALRSFVLLNHSAKGDYNQVRARYQSSSHDWLGYLVPAWSIAGIGAVLQRQSCQNEKEFKQRREAGIQEPEDAGLGTGR